MPSAVRSAVVALPFKRMVQVGSAATVSLKAYQTPPLRSANIRWKRKRSSKPAGIAANLSTFTPASISTV